MLKNGSKKGFLLVKMDFAFLPTAFIVYWILVYCRVGSLEKPSFKFVLIRVVYCRVGSLETVDIYQHYVTSVYCRVGSLETLPV